MYMYIWKYVYTERMVIFLPSHLKLFTVHKRNRICNEKKNNVVHHRIILVNFNFFHFFCKLFKAVVTLLLFMF